MKPIGSPQDRPIVLIHPPSLRRRFLPTRFLSEDQPRTVVLRDLM